MINVLWCRALPWRVRWAALQFSKQRADYYDYVAACLDVQARHRSLLEFLQLDATRRSKGGCRAVLAQWWASQFLLTGANLTETLRGTLPAAEVACLELAKNVGQQALLQMLRALAQQRNRIDACRKHFLRTVMAGLIALVVAVLVMTALPMYSLPKLLQTFAMVRSVNYGSATLTLCAWVSAVTQWGWALLLILFMLIGLSHWSLANWTAPIRDRFDRVWIWRMWRDLQAVEFLSLTATLIHALGSRGVSLRTIVQMQVDFSNPYRQGHLLRALVAMDLGDDPVDAMNTGMIDQECWWRLQDVVHGYGLGVGFARASHSVLDLLERCVERQAVVWRVTLLGIAVSGVLYMGYWHACVIEELRQGMLLSVGVF